MNNAIDLSYIPFNYSFDFFFEIDKIIVPETEYGYIIPWNTKFIKYRKNILKSDASTGWVAMLANPNSLLLFEH